MALAPRLSPGSIFARDFKVIDLLAEGGMGAVYRVEQLSTRKLRALKLVTARLASDPKGRQRFVREATVGASIDSEHVVEVIGAGIDEQSGRPWLAMELLDGADLGAVVQHHGTLTAGQLREVVGQLCHGLQAAHRAGVVHRDLKPANVFVARSRRAGVPFTIKILDFGIAKVVQESGTGTETDTVGSPLWMAPEQLDAQRPSPATDVWALGLLAFWALTGKHYWRSAHAEASTVQALFVEQLFKPLDPATERATELHGVEALPVGFDAWFSRCLARDPKRRFKDAAQAGAALLPLLPVDPAGAIALLPNEVLPPSTGRTEPQHRTAAATGSEATLMGDPTGWDASALVPGAMVDAARSSFEGEATRADPVPLGADLSRAPLPGSVGRGRGAPRTSPLVVMLAVALLVGAMLGGGYLLWSWQAAESDQATMETPRSTDLVDRDDTNESTSTAAPSMTGGTGSSDDSTGEESPPPPDLGGSDEPSGPALELIVPLRHQLDATAREIDFLGWTPQGHRFALKVEHRDDKRGEPNRLTVIELHDALTGSLVESFLVDRDVGPSISAYTRLSKAAGEARPRAEWNARREALRIAKRSPRRKSPTGAALTLEVTEVPPGTSLSTPPSRLGVAFRWSGFGAATEAGSTRVAPTVKVTLEQEQERWTLLESELPFTVRELLELPPVEGDERAVSGRVLAYWSPDGRRAVLLLEVDVRPGSDGPSHRRWMLRSAGPQIRVVEAGSGQRTAREVALRLDAAGLPVAEVALREPPVATSVLVLPRGRSDLGPLADRIRAVLPRMPAPERRRVRGFADALVVLGQDSAD